MANSFVDEFKKLWSNQRIDESMGVGLMIWASGKKSNIHNMQVVNNHLKWVDRNIFIGELSLLNTMSGFLRSPSVKKQDDSLDFFYKDICEYYGWSSREFELNKEVLDFEFLRGEVAKTYGYDSKQIRLLKKLV
jgi:hypothetical protein